MGEMKLDKYQLAWAAGFFDGEGSTCFSERGQIQMEIPQSEPGTLLRFCTAVKFLGNVRGPYAQGGFGSKVKYVWFVGNHEHVQAVLAMLWRFLSGPKRKQAAAALGKWRDRRVARALRSATAPTLKEM